MTISLKHLFQSAKSDGVDSTVVQPSDWNADHVLTAAAGKVLGTLVGSTTVSELPLTVDATGQSVVPPSGTTLQRPVTPSAGMIRYNSTTARLEGYASSAWTPLNNAASRAGSAPSNPYAGDLWVNSSTEELQVYNGSAFAGVLTTPLDGSVTLAKLAAALQAFLVPTGSVSPYIGTSAPTGWLLCSGKTIGSADSGADARANADTQTLYELLWNSFASAELAIYTAAGVATTRGGSAASDFSAHKRLALPDLRGRAIAGKDDMGGSTASRLTTGGAGINGTLMGAAGGAQTHTLSISEMPAHTHTVAISSPTGNASDGGASRMQSGGSTTTSSTGGGGAHNNVQPTIVMNYIIKL